jgi:phytoene synthase
MTGGAAPADVDRTAAVVMASVARTFDLATHFLPADLRRDVQRLYLVLRTLDDLVDTGDPGAESRVALVEGWAGGTEADSGPSQGPEAPILEDLASRYPSLPRDAVRDFCAGMRADIAGPRHETDGELAVYCYRVAGTVGRLMASLLGTAPGHGAEADRAARALGTAMQRTNIIRDLVEDARNGRVYLPLEELRAAGLDVADPPALLTAIDRWPRDTREALLRRQIALADAGYDEAAAGMAFLRRGRWGVAAASAIYREILRQIERDGLGADPRRAVVSRGRKALVLARLAIRGGRV